MSNIKLPPLPRKKKAITKNPFNGKSLYSSEQLDDYAKVYARAAVQANVPNGWVMVPVEPTTEMAEAYLKANSEYWERTDALPTPSDRWRTGTPVDATKASYRAMLSAIQKG